MIKKKLVLVTRNSRLALWQAEYVKHCLQTIHPHLLVEIVPKITRGDIHCDVPLRNIGGKNLFAKELQLILLRGEADIAVHSVKDLAAKTLPDLQLAAILERADPRDALLSSKFASLDALPEGAVVGTASPRRQSQLLAYRSDLSIKLLRGNLETRLKKLASQQYDAIILAVAGLQRLDLTDKITEYLTPEILLPAIGQGAIGVECRAADVVTQALLSPLNHVVTAACVRAERAVNARLGGDCFTPIAAWATCNNDYITLKARVGSLNGKTLLTATAGGLWHEAETIGASAAQSLLEQGAAQFLQAS